MNWYVWLTHTLVESYNGIIQAKLQHTTEISLKWKQTDFR